MSTLKTFNSLNTQKQCQFVLDILDGNSPNDDLGKIIQEGVEQGESKEKLVKILLLLKSINKGQFTLLEDLTPLWVQTIREDKLNEILS
jgi:hypothetical protein